MFFLVHIACSYRDYNMCTGIKKMERYQTLNQMSWIFTNYAHKSSPNAILSMTVFLLYIHALGALKTFITVYDTNDINKYNIVVI